MTLRRWLVVPLLTPLLAVVLVAALNPSPQLSFRVLTWSTPRAPLGLWLAGAALGGAALSGAASTVALRQGQTRGLGRRRRVTTPPFSPSRTATESQDRRGWRGFAEVPTSSRRETSARPSHGNARFGEEEQDHPWRDTAAVTPPPRSPSEPAPTMDVPFRVLYRPSSDQGENDSGAPFRASRERDPVPVGRNDDWGQEDSAEDW